ncbi:hypothetical protein [Sphingomonas sp.]|uniref:hypothetical protein n=1 Tax=Sphingomonas sp. TaxID=28214 RepID=UPI0035ADDDE6
MNLLLLLSALLSALTGAVGVTRRTEAQQVVSAPAAVSQAAIVRVAAVSSRPAQALPGLHAVRGLAVFVAPVPRAIMPLYASRRRE